MKIPRSHLADFSLCLITVALFLVVFSLASCVSFGDKGGEIPKADPLEESLDAKLKSAAAKPGENSGQRLFVPDSEIRKNLKKSFQKTRSVAGRDVHLSIREGEVILIGKVGSVAEKNLADALVRTSPGIRKVKNKLRIVPQREHPWPRGDSRGLADLVHDRQILDAVRRKLARTGQARLSQMKIEVYLGVVILAGPVQDLGVKKRNYNAVLYIPKVRAVIDNTWVEKSDKDEAEPPDSMTTQ
jgi:osmotically-inducible protein OsmY